MVLTKEFLSTFLSYDPATGVITRTGYCPTNRVKTRKEFIGKPTGSVNKHGYVQVQIAGKNYPAHRLAFVLMSEAMPDYVDHADGDRQNNRWDNLRVCDMSQNMSNRGASTRSASGVKGVFQHKPSGRWRAQIMVMYKTVSLGYFDTCDAAAEAYRRAAVYYFGEFAHEPPRGDI